MDHPAEFIGKALVVLGSFIILVGLFLWLGPRLSVLRVGKLPGDIVIHRENFRFYFPLGTSVLVSVLVTVLLYLIRYFRR
jgi:hypothetical protein